MSSRAALYQTKLTGYFRVRAQAVLGDAIISPYHADEGREWWPINVDMGSRSDPIDVEWWSYLRPMPVKRPEETLEVRELVGAVPASEPDSDGSGSGSSVHESVRDGLVDSKVFDCGICWDTLYKPVVPMCMHVFCYDCLHKWFADKKRTCPLCRSRVGGRPIRDCAFEGELEVAISEGRVAGVDKERVTGTAAPSSPTFNLNPSSIPMDQLPTPVAAQPEILSVHTLDSASDIMDWLAAIEGSLTSMQLMLKYLLHHNQNLLPAPAPAILAPALGPDFLALHPAAKLVLQPNPPAIFDSDRMHPWTAIIIMLTMSAHPFG
ncbi:hypothetical protein DFH08DRAFT_977094 [Mycena albidolilacea]|uniref:RING-type E3 ubiquitin transferase n=1 Tax=Mycena albidolilacea TaxID=1033008 RepID=A0AAD6Z1B5_9AGAR|nr:hypothetical protein DFH08DRAFT_977094 [Mycena albidolilacea]